MIIKKYDTPYATFDEAAKTHGLEWIPTPRQMIAKQIAEAIATDRESKIRQALIDLGWTPPKHDEMDQCSKIISSPPRPA